MKNKPEYSAILKGIADHLSVQWHLAGNLVTFQRGEKHVSFYIVGEGEVPEEMHFVIHADQLIRQPGKIQSILQSRLGLNSTVFARVCEIKKLTKEEAASFFDTYHLMNSTSSAFNYGLFYKHEVLAVASFSKGRKMKRLPAAQRSFELIRFCCRSGITVTGGLTKLVKHFCEEKKAGDVMTYVDKQLSDGSAFIKAGFKKAGETEPNYFLVNKNSYTRVSSAKDADYDPAVFYAAHNAGNIKLIYAPFGKL